MKASQPRSAKEQLREQLLAAALREQAEERRAARPRRRRRRRGLGLLVGVVALGAAAAGAAELIAVGEPVRDETSLKPQYRSDDGKIDLAAKASDPAGGLPFGVGIYPGHDGEVCAVAGQVRGVELGLTRDGTFHPYAAGNSGACADLANFPLLVDRTVIEGSSPRTIFYGRSGDPARYVLAESGGKTYKAKPARGGAFLFVFAGRLAFDDVRPHVGPRIP